MAFFDLNNIAFEVIGYQFNHVELIGILSWLVSFYFFSSRFNIFTWAIEIINNVVLFILFFLVPLYLEMCLQLYFFIFAIYGCYNWTLKPKQRFIMSIESKSKIWLLSAIIVGTIIDFPLVSMNLSLGDYFKAKATFSFIISFVIVLNMVTTVLLAQKIIETLYLWIVVGIVGVFGFFKKGVVFLALDYLTFLELTIYGLLNWKKQLKNG